MKNHGKLFEYETARGLKVLQDDLRGFMWWRIPDTTLLRFAVSNENVTASTVPSDFMCIAEGTMYLIECKSSRNPVSYGLRYIKDHQLENLRNLCKCRGVGLFLLNRRGRKRGDMRCWIVTPQYIEKVLGEGKKSIKWSEMLGLEVRRVIDKEGKPYWDLKEILSFSPAEPSNAGDEHTP